MTTPASNSVQGLPLLTTKLYIPPPRPSLVPRPRLSERLDAGLERKLTLVSAPAGFGKTTLVSEWVQALDGETLPMVVAWLSLDEGDNDLTRFLIYFVAALQKANVGQGALSALQSPQPPPVEAILTALLNELAVLPGRMVLVLDDYHVIESPPVDAALTFLLDHAPPPMHLVITTREDPQLPLARLRARGQLAELRAADLRFTSSEAAEFLNQAMGLHLMADAIAALETRTEGWITGLQLAALALQGVVLAQGKEHAADFIKSFTGSHRFVLDYLIEEVLEQQPASVQAFMLQTAILERLNSSLCDALTGRDDGQETLEALERGNLFIVPLDGERRWYRYHQLFADLLRQRLQQIHPEQIPNLHSRASQWHAQNGFTAEAIEHALRAGDFERAADLIELAWPAMEKNYVQSATWHGWARALPDELVRARPVLSVGYAWGLLDDGELEDAEAHLRDAERWLETPAAAMVVADEDQFRALPGTIAAARAYRAQALGDVPATIKYTRRVLDFLPEADYLRREQATALLGLAYWASGDLQAAQQSFADFMAIAHTAGDVHEAIGATFVLADIRAALGRLHEAWHTYQRALQLALGLGEPMPLGTGELYRGMSELCCEWNDLRAAAQYLLRGKELSEPAAQPDWQRRLRVAAAHIKEAQGDLEGALELLDQAERLHIRTPLPDVHPIAALKARIWIAQGRLTEALGWARAQGLSVDDDLSYLREFEHVTLARLLIARYESDRAERSILEALGLLERLLAAAERGKRMGSVIEILVLQALAHQAQGNTLLALASLERALDIAEPEGYVRAFVDKGAPLARLLSEAATRRITPDYTDKLLAALKAEAQKSAGKSHPPPAPSTQPLVEPLSLRELEVLQLIAQGLSNREICEQLFIALDTVKGHNRKIFGKLEVQRRTEAVARARELGLL